MKYTKGKWKIQNNGQGNGGSNIDIHIGKGPFDNQWIAEAKGSHVGPIDDEERLNNAKLISKAPEMYEALKWLRDNYNEDNITISSTGMHATFHENMLIDKLLEIETLINELE